MLVKRFFLGLSLGILLTGALSVALGLFSLPHPVAAQTAFTVEDLGTTLGLGSADLKDVVINVIKWVLGILALVGVVMLIYAGVLWMTSAGNAEKIDRAKRIIVSALIGLVIVLISWAIVTYVIRTFLNVTNPDVPTCDNPGESCGSCLLCSADGLCNVPDPICNGLPDLNVFAIREIETAHSGGQNHQEVFRCSKVQPNFNTNASNDTVQEAATAGTLRVQDAAGNPVDGSWSTADKVITFKHPDAVFDSFATYTALFPKTLKNTGGLTLSECDADGGCLDVGDHFEWAFTTNDVLDTDAPTVTTAYPVTSGEAGYPDRAVPRDPIISIRFSEAVDLTTLVDADNHPIPGRFTLERLDGQGGSVVGTVDSASLEVSSGADTRVDFRFIGGAMLDAFTWYRITVQDVEDLCGNALQPPEVWEFETDDTVAGIRSFDPTGNLVCPDTAVTAVFTLSMWNNSVSIEINNPDTAGVDYSATMPAPNTLPGPDYSVPGVGGTFTITDPNPDDPGHGFKVYKFIPTDPLASNATFNVSITTDRVTNPDGTTLSGSWSFATATPETCACKPFIERVSPETGSPGQCVTLQGSCFTGTVENSADPLDPDFDTDAVFPAPQTTSPILNDPPSGHYLVTTIPSSFSVNDEVYSQVTIDYTEDTFGQQTSSAGPAFRVTSSDPASGPCLASVSPEEGYRGQSVRASGSRFGAAQGTMTYFNGQPGPITDWSDTSARSDVPAGATSGTHDVFVTSAAGQSSNAVPFTVKDYPPGELFVVSPWPTCDAVCVNAILRASFRPTSIDVDATTLTPATILIKRCTDPSCSSFDAINIPATDIVYDADAHEVSFRPGVLLSQNRWYAVILIGGDGGIQGSEDQTLGNTNTEYLGVPAYQWKFKTKDDPNLCTVDHVDVTPASAQITDQDGTKQFNGKAFASPDQCDPDGQQIDTSAAPWTWTVQPAADADLNADPEPTDRTAIIQANQETTLPPPPDTATVRGTWGGKTDTSLLSIDFLWCDESTDCTKGGLCPGSTCNVAENRCTPVITNYTPAGGAIGTWATINGCYFGSYKRGTCQGGSNDGAACDTSYGDCPGGTCEGGSQVVYTSNKQGLWPDGAICPNPNELWRNEVIRASEVPNNQTPADPTDDAIDGPLTVVRGLDGVSDTTNDGASGEPILPNFDVNGTTVPGICSVNPDEGPSGQRVTIAGQNFGARNPAQDRVSFGLIDVATYNAWTNALIDVLVPLGVPTGLLDLVVHKNTVPSNAWPFTVSSAACTVCVDDGSCGAGQGCADNGCCAPQPAVTSTIPANGATDVCRNAMIEANFSLAMKTTTMTDANVRLTVDGGSGNGTACSNGSDCASGVCSASLCVGDTVDTTIVRKQSTLLRAAPAGLLLRDTAYTMTLSNLESQSGVRLPDYEWGFTTVDSDLPCTMTSVEVDPAQWAPTAPAQDEVFTAQPKNGDTNIIEIPGVYDWTWDWTSSDTNVATLSSASELPDGSAQVTATTGATSGQSTIRAKATILLNGAPAGEKTGTSLINFLRCEQPWSFDDAANNCDIPGASCVNENFHLDYCRDTGNLPDFSLSVVKGETGDVLKQYLFKENNPSALDAIGLRVYANPEFLSPTEWYKRQFPFESGSPSTIVVDGYQAVQNGRTVYLAGTNLTDGPQLIPTIFILSYNNDATPETKDIFTQLLSRMRLNTNIGPDDKTLIARDTKRLADLQDVALKLAQYRLENDVYPPLEAGSYLTSFSTSLWPSWQSTLGNLLGSSLPQDPAAGFARVWTDPVSGSCPSEFTWDDLNANDQLDVGECWRECPLGYESSTCWRESSKTFQCNPGSQVYAYQSLDATGSAYALYANLEYNGLGTWRTNDAGDPCDFDDGHGNSQCACFNYSRP